MELSVIGAIGCTAISIILFKWLMSVYNVVYPYLIARPRNLLEVAGGKWAMITGGTDGIGKQYALELARRGFSIIVIARSMEKLKEVKLEIENETNAEVRVLGFDFTSADVEKYAEAIFSKVEGLDIGILINNVGVCYDYPDFFHKVKGGMHVVKDVSIVNIVPCVLLCALVLPQMLDRNRGIIVNVSSASSYLGTIMLAAYAAAKMHVTSFSSILRREYANTNIIIQSLSPMLVSTKMIKKSYPTFFAPLPEDFVKNAINTIGIVDDTTGCLAHQIQMELAKNTPRFMLDIYMDLRYKRINQKILHRKCTKGVYYHNCPLNE